MCLLHNFFWGNKSGLRPLFDACVKVFLVWQLTHTHWQLPGKENLTFLWTQGTGPRRTIQTASHLGRTNSVSPISLWDEEIEAKHTPFQRRSPGLPGPPLYHPLTGVEGPIKKKHCVILLWQTHKINLTQRTTMSMVGQSDLVYPVCYFVTREFLQGRLLHSYGVDPDIVSSTKMNHF